MADVIYPYDSLPSPHFTSSGIKQVPSLLVSEMESGRSRVRRRFRSVPAIMSLTWRLSSGEAAFFLGWVSHALSGGTSSFVLNMRTPAGVVPHEFQFLTHPSDDVKPEGSSWLYSAKVKVRELFVISEEETVSGLFLGLPGSEQDFVDDVVSVSNNVEDML